MKNNTKESRIHGAVITIWIVILLGLNFLLKIRTFIWLCMLLSAVAAIIKVFLHFSYEKDKYRDVSQMVTLGWTVMFFILALPAMSYYSFSDGGFASFLGVSLVLGIVAGSAIAYKFFWKNCKTFKQKLVLLLTFMVMAVIVIYVHLAHFNYILDTKEPQQCTAVIEDKEYTRYRKSPDSYEFKVTVDGKTFDLEVESSEYDSYNIGDTYQFTKYEGAFGEPFFIAE